MDTVAATVPDAVQFLPAMVQRLQAEAKRHADATIAHALETNNQHFTEARDKLDRWAEDMELVAEQALKNTKEQIKVVQREARQATTLAEQQTLQERIAKLERQKRRQQQEIFDVSDEIQDKREALIDELTRRMTQRVNSENLFTIAWSVN
jgi:predicted  nucleic acid-binding Zn-ribbon protein